MADRIQQSMIGKCDSCSAPGASYNLDGDTLCYSCYQQHKDD